MNRLFASRFPRLPSHFSIDNSKAISACKPSDVKLRFTSAAANTRMPPKAVSIEDKDVKPYSEIPTDDRHWIWNVLEIFFTNGGPKKSLYKIQEKSHRNLE